MAEINSNNQSKTKGKRLSTRVDLTPMVDLGFLLITFFIFTTTMNEAHALNLPLPQDGEPSEAPVSKTLNIVLGDRNRCWHYNGDDISTVQSTGYGPGGLRTVLAKKRQEIISGGGVSKDMIVLIKPGSESSYQNLVDVLDEMLILDIKRYVIMDPVEKEARIIAQR